MMRMVVVWRFVMVEEVQTQCFQILRLRRIGKFVVTASCAYAKLIPKLFVANSSSWCTHYSRKTD